MSVGHLHPRMTAIYCRRLPAVIVLLFLMLTGAILDIHANPYPYPGAKEKERRETTTQPTQQQQIRPEPQTSQQTAPVQIQQQQQQQPPPQPQPNPDRPQPPNTSRGQLGLTADPSLSLDDVEAWRWEAQDRSELILDRLLDRLGEEKEGDPRALVLLSYLRDDRLRSSFTGWLMSLARVKYFLTLQELLPEYFEHLRDLYDDMADAWRDTEYNSRPGSPERTNAKNLKDAFRAAADQFDYWVDHPEESDASRGLDANLESENELTERYEERLGDDLRTLAEDLMEELDFLDVEPQARRRLGLSTE